MDNDMEYDLGYFETMDIWVIIPPELPQVVKLYIISAMIQLLILKVVSAIFRQIMQICASWILWGFTLYIIQLG